MKDSIEEGVFLMGKNKNTVSNKSKNDNFSPTKSTEISFLGTRKRESVKAERKRLPVAQRRWILSTLEEEDPCEVNGSRKAGWRREPP